MSVPYARIHFLAAPHHQGPARNEKVQWIAGGKSSDELRHIRYRAYPVSFVSISFRRVPRIKLARSKRSIFFSERLSLSAECLLFRSVREKKSEGCATTVVASAVPPIFYATRRQWKRDKWGEEGTQTKENKIYEENNAAAELNLVASGYAGTKKKKEMGEAQTSFIIERRNPRFPIAPLSLSACRLSFSPSAQQPVPQHTGPTPQIDSLSEHWFAAFAPRLGSVQ